MAKILILDGDTQETEMDVKDERFVFLLTKSGRVYHIDLSDENMFRSVENLENLGPAHRKLVSELLSR